MFSGVKGVAAVASLMFLQGFASAHSHSRLARPNAHTAEANKGVTKTATDTMPSHANNMQTVGIPINNLVPVNAHPSQQQQIITHHAPYNHPACACSACVCAQLQHTCDSWFSSTGYHLTQQASPQPGHRWFICNPCTSHNQKCTEVQWHARACAAPRDLSRHHPFQQS